MVIIQSMISPFGKRTSPKEEPMHPINFYCSLIVAVKSEPPTRNYNIIYVCLYVFFRTWEPFAIDAII